jgi:hypothetical protein
VQHADELVNALQSRKAQLQEQLKAQNEVDASITKQIQDIEGIILSLQRKSTSTASLSPIEQLRNDMEQLIDATRRETSAELSEIWESTYRRVETELAQRIARDEYHEAEIARLKTEIANLRLQNQNAAARGATAQKAQSATTTTASPTKVAARKKVSRKAGKKR